MQEEIPAEAAASHLVDEQPAIEEAEEDEFEETSEVAPEAAPVEKAEEAATPAETGDDTVEAAMEQPPAGEIPGGLRWLARTK